MSRVEPVYERIALSSPCHMITIRSRPLQFVQACCVRSIIISIQKRKVS